MVKISDFYGYWKIKSRNGIYSETTFMIIDESSIFFFLGPINYVRANSYYDTLITYFGKDPYFSVYFKIIGNKLYIKIIDSELYISNGYLICSFINGNKNNLQFTSYATNYEYPFDTKPYIRAIYFERLNSIPETLIQSINFPNAINWNNPKLLLNYWISHFKCSYNTVPISGTNYFSLKQFNEISKIFLENTKGIERKACIQWIYKSTNIPITYKPIIFIGAIDKTPPTISYYGTVLFICKYHKITRSNRVAISGYKGEWKVINGIWDLDPLVYSNSITYPSERAFTCSNRRYIIIPFDSRNLPEYNPLKHGNGEVKSFHKSISENSSYRDMIVALDELILTTGFSTHTRGYYIAIIKDVNKPPVIPETYKEIQDLLDTNPAYVVNVRFRSRTYPQCNGYMYINPNKYYNQINKNYPSFDINNPFNIDSTLNYSIVINNYLQEGSVKTIYYKEKLNGEIVFQVGDIGVIPPGYDTLNSEIIFGFVNQSRTNENRVGYIYYPNFQFIDPNFKILIGIPENRNYYIYLLIGTIMNYLITNYKIQDIIFDIRGNGGGFERCRFPVACSVGGKRNYFISSSDPTGNPCNPDLYRTDYPYIDPAEMEKVIQNSVLYGTPQRTANVIIIDDINAASAGDIFPNQFIGDNGDGELGNNTKAYIVGNIDGRYSGDIITALFPPVKTPDEAAIHYSNDISGDYAIPPFSFENDMEGSFLYANTNKEMFYFQKETTPTILIPHDFSVAYSDMGYLPPTIKYLNNVQPDKNDLTTWQDSYFENAIRIILKYKPEIPKAYKYVQIGNDKPFIFCQKVYQNEKQKKHKFIDQYPIEQTKNDQYPIGKNDQYPIGKNDQYPNYPQRINNNSNLTPKYVKCSNVVVNQTEIKSKNVSMLSKLFAKRTYLDNMTQLKIELRKESRIVIPNKIFSKKDFYNKKLLEILNKKIK
jgi:hypothetical protein